MGKTNKIKISGILGLFLAFLYPFQVQAGLETIFVAQSIRAAKQEGCPADYEISAGIQTEKFLDVY